MSLPSSNIDIPINSQETARNHPPIVKDDAGEKFQKLFVVVSDADSTSNSLIPIETAKCHLLNVDELETNESINALSTRQRSSTCCTQHYREQYPRKSNGERFRRSSWMVCQSNVCQATDVILQNQQTMNILRARRYRLGQSEPNLTSLQSDSFPQTTTTATATNSSLQSITRRSSVRRRNIPSSNLINLKHALRKQLSPQPAACLATLDSHSDSNTSDSFVDRRWSCTSAPSSSGYGTTSPPCSQYSSFERLQHQQHICTCRQQLDTNLNDDMQRLESRSISMSLLDANILPLPNKLMTVPDQDLNTMAFIFKERYPKAKIQMEERLKSFIEKYKPVDKYEHCSDGSARFIHNQIVELAKDCFDKSNSDLITTLYFNEMTTNLERLLINTNEKCPQAINSLQTIARELLLIIARSARLLECLHFDPEEFLRTLEEAECQAKTITNLKQDIPKYICSKLNLDRNPLDLIDGLQINESTANNTELFHARSMSESDNESLTNSNYLTIPSSSIKSPHENDFEIIKLISNGAYGAVHLVKHKQTQERYAMKKISKTNLILRNQVEQAFVERDIMTFTDNPFVVALICTFETKNHLCLVMEYVEGGDVATLLKNIGGPLNIDIARMYFCETTLAVEYLHSYGIIHRDLKPDNLLITSVGHIKLTDFGLSKIGLMSLTTDFYEKHTDKEVKAFNDKQIYGTPSYIAPEVILRQGYGKPADWWSMGIILYEFLVGIPPFTGDTPDELFENVISGDIDWDQLTGDVNDNSSDAMVCHCARDLIEGLLEHDPSKRLCTSRGAFEIRVHEFCSSINWNTLLREKADFVPVLESPDDTSYFDTRIDRYKHSDGDDDSLSTSTNNDSDPLFASFSSVKLKHLLELSADNKQKQQNNKPENVLRANSCTDSFHSSDSINSDLMVDRRSLNSTHSLTTEEVESITNHEFFNSDTFDALPISSDESESSSTKLSNDNEKKTTSTLTKHNKPRQSSLKTFDKQNSIDSGDDNQQETNTNSYYHKRSRIPRVLSPIKIKQQNLLTPVGSTSTDSSYKSSKYNKCTYTRSASKSFSSSSSSSSPPPPLLYFTQGDRSPRHNYRQKLTVSPLERDTTLKVNKQASYIPSDIPSMTNSLRPPIIIRRGPRSFGFTLRAVKVFHGDTDFYTTQHIVVAVQGPAEEAGLKPNDIITHVNGHPVTGCVHSEVVKLILSGSERLSIRAVPCSETQIRIGGRRRSPLKQKNRYQPTPDKKSSATSTDNHSHQTHCSKHRVNSLGNTSSNSTAKKHYQNTSLFRRLSEKRVEAAVAAAGSVSLVVPVRGAVTSNNNNNNNANLNTSTTNSTDSFSTSLPLLSYNPLINNNIDEQRLSNSALTNQFDSSQTTSLPIITKHKSLTSNSSLNKCPLISNETIHTSLYKTTSEPQRYSLQSTSNCNQNQYSPRQNNDCCSVPMVSSKRKKLVRQSAINIPSSSQSFSSTKTVWENNIDRSHRSSYQNSLTRSWSNESSTLSYDDNHASKPVFFPTRVFYRRK